MLYLIGRASIGGPSSWLYPAALIASILMLFSGVLTLIGWANKVRLVALIGSLMLVLWWVPALAYTLYVYFSPGSPSSDPLEILWAVAPALLALVSLIAGIVLFRSRCSGEGRIEQAR